MGARGTGVLSSTNVTEEQGLEAEVARLIKVMRAKESLHQEELRAASKVDIGHYYNLLDEVDQLRESLQSRPNEEAPQNLDRQSQETASAELRQTAERVVVLPKELRPSKDEHTLQLIKQFTRMKEALVQRRGQITKARTGIIAVIKTKKHEIHQIQAQARKACEQDEMSTQVGLLADPHAPQAIFTSERPSMHHRMNRCLQSRHPSQHIPCFQANIIPQLAHPAFPCYQNRTLGSAKAQARC
jgi:hypothetical protein